MNPSEKIQLQNMIMENNVVDQTENIRNLKHSQYIKRDIISSNVCHIKFKEMKLNQRDLFDEKIKSECFFLYNNYTDIFNKLKDEEIDVSLLLEFVNLLEKIENNQVDQHTASYEVGKILKTIYIDSALKKNGNIDENNIEQPGSVPAKTPININWKQYKKTL
jgi:hypothetical protein